MGTIQLTFENSFADLNELFNPKGEKGLAPMQQRVLKVVD
jgi:hypothetical protein